MDEALRQMMVCSSFWYSMIPMSMETAPVVIAIYRSMFIVPSSTETPVAMY